MGSITVWCVLVSSSLGARKNFWRRQHHTLTWQRRGAPPAPLLPHPPPPKKACPASEGKKKTRTVHAQTPPHDAALPFCGPPYFCQVYFFWR